MVLGVWFWFGFAFVWYGFVIAVFVIG